MGLGKSSGILFFIFLFCFLFVSQSFAISQKGCLSCHKDKELVKVDSIGKQISMYVDVNLLKNSEHKDLACQACHRETKSEAHIEKPKVVDCGECHFKIYKEYREGIHGEQYAFGNKDAPNCQDCHSYHNIKKTTDPTADTYRLNVPQMCAKCHTSIEMAKKYEIPAPYEAYEKSIHGRAGKEKGLSIAAVCTDCHRHVSHNLRPHTDPFSPINRANVPKTCGQCHLKTEADYKESVHGKAWAKGSTDAPVCNDCHTEHSIEQADEKTSTIYGATISRTTCPRCHSAERISTRYGVVTVRSTDYLDSYHGVASRAGVAEAANCASCHGYHDILPSSDPRSSINKANISKTCGKCHPNAGENFAKGSMHLAPTKETDIVEYWVGKIYISVIVITIGGMVLHNSALMFRHLREKYKKSKKGKVTRFDKQEIVWHFLLFLSFTTLIITGFALRYPDAFWAKPFAHSLLGFKLRSLIHRIAGVIFTGLFVYNVLYSIFSEHGRKVISEKFPVIKDISDVTTNVKYTLGLSSQKPVFDKFNYTEKAEYWALMWGGMVMIVTGFPMWFKGQFLQFIPKWLWDVFKAVHFYEAWLATLAILVWHMFFMIFDPDTYPVTWSWITGKISIREMRERHPLEYKRMVARGEIDETMEGTDE